MDDFNREPPAAKYRVNLEKAGKASDSTFETVSDMYSTRVDLGAGLTLTSPSHMLHQPEARVRHIVYNDASVNVKRYWKSDPDDRPVAKIVEHADRQADIARFVWPGEIAISIKHHATHPEPEQAIKLQCTHIQIVVGVETDDGPGAITINNPQRYHEEVGLFGTQVYPLILLKPRFPGHLSAETKRHYVDNMRTWLIIANTFTDFPYGNYNGNDPLATRTVSQVETLGDRLLGALTGEASDVEWLQDPANLVYCAELAHVALNLGIHVPINKPYLGESRYRAVRDMIESGGFVEELNGNPYAQQVELTTAPDDLRPLMVELGIQPRDPGQGDAFGTGLAMQPFTVADMLESFVHFTIPRDRLGEDTAELQAKVLTRCKPELFEMLELTTLSEDDPRRVAATAVWDGLVNVVGTRHADYDAFRSKLQPLLQKARRMTAPRGGGAGAFVPPTAFLVRATQAIRNGGDPPDITHGCLGWQYLGHGVHQDLADPL